MKLLIINYSDKNGGAAIATHRIYKSLKKKLMFIFMLLIKIIEIKKL